MVRAGMPGGRCPDRGDGPCQLGGGEPQRAATDLLRPAPPPGRRLSGAAAVLPEPPGAGAERAAGAAGEDAGGVAHRRGARALAGAAGLPSLRPLRLIAARLAAVARTRRGRARGRSAPRQSVTLESRFLNQAPKATCSRPADSRSCPSGIRRACQRFHRRDSATRASVLTES